LELGPDCGPAATKLQAVAAKVTDSPTSASLIPELVILSLEIEINMSISVGLLT